MQASPSPSRLPFLRRWVSIAVAVALVYFLWQSLASYTTRIAEFRVVPGALALVVTFLGFVAWGLLLELGWEWLLRGACGQAGRVAWLRSAVAFFKSYLLRYIPGKVVSVAARVESLMPQISRADGLRSQFYEQVHLNGSVAVLALAVMPLLLELGTPIHAGWTVLLLAMAVALMVVWLVFPRPLFALINRLLQRVPKWRGDALTLHGSLRHWRLGFALYLFINLSMGLLVVPVMLSLAPSASDFTFNQWFVIVTAYPVARLLGQAAVVAPGGLGVREGTYVVMLLPILDGGVTTIVVLWVRLISLLAELATMGGLLLAQFMRRQREGRAVAAPGTGPVEKGTL